MFAFKARPVHSLGAMVAAAAIATELAPILFYAFTMPVAPLPPMGVYKGPMGVLHASLSALMFVPQVFAALFAVALLAGWLLSRLGVRHVAFYALAGAIVSFAASRLAPLIIGSTEALILSPELSSLNMPWLIAAVLLAGMADGAIFGLLAQQFTPRDWAGAEKAGT